MSNQSDLTLVQTIAATLITTLQTEIEKSNGALFPNGVNDFFLKVQFGDTSVELEISSANAIHAETALVDIPAKTVRPGHGPHP